MKYPKFILLSVIIIAFCIGVFGAVFVFRGGNWGLESPSSIPSPSPLATPLKENTKAVVTPKETNAETALERCIAAERKEVGKVEYEKGSLLVSFKSAVTFGSAREVVESNGLKYQSRENIGSDFKTNHWLGVIVPRGEEFKWICILKENPKVKAAIVNRLFDLHL